MIHKKLYLHLKRNLYLSQSDMIKMLIMGYIQSTGFFFHLKKNKLVAYQQCVYFAIKKDTFYISLSNKKGKNEKVENGFEQLYLYN